MIKRFSPHTDADTTKCMSASGLGNRRRRIDRLDKSFVWTIRILIAATLMMIT